MAQRENAYPEALQAEFESQSTHQCAKRTDSTHTSYGLCTPRIRFSHRSVVYNRTLQSKEEGRNQKKKKIRLSILNVITYYLEVLRHHLLHTKTT